MLSICFHFQTLFTWTSAILKKKPTVLFLAGEPLYCTVLSPGDANRLLMKPKAFVSTSPTFAVMEPLIKGSKQSDSERQANEFRAALLCLCVNPRDLFE